MVQMAYHSTVSVTQFIRRHPELFSEWKKSEDPSSPVKDKKPNIVHKPKDDRPRVEYHPGDPDAEDPPKAPTDLTPFAKGYRFTADDDKFIVCESSQY